MKLTKLDKSYLYDFVNRVEEYEKPTEVSHTNKLELIYWIIKIK